MFIIIDGIDGSGKTTVMRAWADYFVQQGKTVFDLKQYWLEHKKHPEYDEIKNHDVIVSYEPTNVWIGTAIRQEMIKGGNDYSAFSIAQAYALDRLILYKKLIVPALNKGKTIIQDRGVSTSLCYQPLQGKNITMEEIAKIEGNQFALKHAPNHLIVADVLPEIAIQRLTQRTEKQDKAIFEKKEFLEKAREQFLNPDYQKYFINHGTKIHVLDCNEKIDIMKQKAVDLLKKIN